MEPNPDIGNNVNIPHRMYHRFLDIEDPNRLIVTQHIFVSRRTGDIYQVVTEDTENIVAGTIGAHGWRREDNGRFNLFTSIDLLAPNDWNEEVRNSRPTRPFTSTSTEREVSVMNPHIPPGHVMYSDLDGSNVRLV